MAPVPVAALGGVTGSSVRRLGVYCRAIGAIGAMAVRSGAAMPP
jgi:hypothetical protein